MHLDTVLRREMSFRSVVVVVIALRFNCCYGRAHLDLHGSYLVDDYSGTWTSFDGIGAISGGGVCAPFCRFIFYSKCQTTFSWEI